MSSPSSTVDVSSKNVVTGLRVPVMCNEHDLSIIRQIRPLTTSRTCIHFRQVLGQDERREDTFMLRVYIDTAAYSDM